MAHGTARVELAPLPASAQFLDVIESVFSGLARAIIHNSDYSSVSEGNGGNRSLLQGTERTLSPTSETRWK